jgi:hypothetical protein
MKEFMKFIGAKSIREYTNETNFCLRPHNYRYLVLSTLQCVFLSAVSIVCLYTCPYVQVCNVPVYLSWFKRWCDLCRSISGLPREMLFLPAGIPGSPCWLAKQEQAGYLVTSTRPPCHDDSSLAFHAPLPHNSFAGAVG